MVYVEEAELAVEELLRERQVCEVLVEALDVLLHDEHADHRGDGEHDEQRDAEANGAEQVQRARDD